jgi:putative transposase
VSRPLRIEFAGALYHITARGNERRAIFYGDEDSTRFLGIQTQTCKRFHWLCHAYCLMGNHYHLLVETLAPNLSKGMHYLNGEYSRWFNSTHGRTGHLFQGRFKSILVEKEAYLLELARYIVLNPVRAGMVRGPQEWRWSSYRSTAGMDNPPDCLTTDWLLARFSTRKAEACLSYRRFVSEGRGIPNPMAQLKHQIYLGCDQFVDDALSNLNPDQPLGDVPRVHILHARKPLEYFQTQCPNTDNAMVMAYRSGHYTLEEIGNYFGRGRSTVSRKVKAFEGSGKRET